MADLTPSGSEVATTGIRGLGDFFRGLGDIALFGISRRVDMELGTPAHSPDTAQTAPIANDKPAPVTTGLADAITALSPWQIAGLIVAGGLAWGLATGKFR